MVIASSQLIPSTIPSTNVRAGFVKSASDTEGDTKGYIWLLESRIQQMHNGKELGLTRASVCFSLGQDHSAKSDVSRDVLTSHQFRFDLHPPTFPNPV